MFIRVNTSKFVCGTKKFGAFSLAESFFPFEKDALRQYANPLLFDLAFIQIHTHMTITIYKILGIPGTKVGGQTDERTRAAFTHILYVHRAQWGNDGQK